MSAALNPCMTCGACCAHFRVSFYWREADANSTENAVPENLVETINDKFSCMRGTNQPTPRCAALGGEIGKSVACTIYPNRSTTCREFAASFEDGKTHDGRCDEARARHGLAPLTLSDWI